MGDQPNQSKRRSRIVSGVLLCAGLPIGLLGAFGWMVSSHVFVLDLLASHQLLLAWGVLGMCLLCLVMRRWVIGGTLFLHFALSIAPVLHARTLTLPDIDFEHKEPGTIRVVSCNINPDSKLWREASHTLMELQADVIILIEVSPFLSREIRKKGFLEQTAYPNWLLRRWVDKETSPCFIISPHSLARIDPGLGPEATQHTMHARVEHPDGAFIAGLMHPLSPRTVERWETGNRIIRLQHDAARATLDNSGLPMVVGADLNAGPAQHRARVLRAAGLRMSKPAMRYGGSFPEGADVPGALMVQLDDIWTSTGVTPTAWSSFPVLGSDHRAIAIDFRFDQP